MSGCSAQCSRLLCNPTDKSSNRLYTFCISSYLRCMCLCTPPFGVCHRSHSSPPKLVSNCLNVLHFVLFSSILIVSVFSVASFRTKFSTFLVSLNPSLSVTLRLLALRQPFSESEIKYIKCYPTPAAGQISRAINQFEEKIM